MPSDPQFVKLIDAVMVEGGETDNAYYLEVQLEADNVQDATASLWFPKSQCEQDEDGSFWCSRWILDKKQEELEGYILYEDVIL